MNIRFLTLPALLCLMAACGDRAADKPAAEMPAGDATPAAVEDAKPAAIPRSASADGARIFFITPSDGATVSNPVHIEFGVEGMSVVKAGDDQPDSGHHHLLIDTGLPDLALPIPADEHHVHFGDGRTATEITLEPGQHSLQMLLGDHLHVPHDPALVSEVITVTVE